MKITNNAPREYQGISTIGEIGEGFFGIVLYNIVKTSALIFLQWSGSVRKFTLYGVLNILFGVALLIGLIISCVRSRLFKRKWATILFGFCLLSIIPFAYMWQFVSNGVDYRAMMLQSLTLLFVLAGVLYERWTKPMAKNIVCLLLIVISFQHGIMANISYFYLNLCYERTYAEGLEMTMKIHDLQDEYEFDEIAVIGNRPSQDFKHQIVNRETGELEPAGEIIIFQRLLEKTLLYDEKRTVYFLNTAFGVALERLEQQQREELQDTEQFKEMPRWPAEDSMAVIDDVLVIKFSDPQ